MKKRIIFLTFCTIMLLSGCQSTDQKSVLSQQSSDIQELKLAEFIGLASYNGHYEKEYTKKEDVNIFKKGFQQAETKNYDLNKYDYNLRITLSDETNRELHLTKTDNNEIVLKYIGDNPDTLVIDSKHAKNIIELIYKEAGT
ncbi:hypothetical protein SH601_10350 [Gracilibacillus sp. S3-1-1]|uniref:Uncharacterized protein n=1 Tax=Gracilibacillus pellucidus TaxID=3095368 RepID=A0ACC6M671_9BACI|nr:hypothetical protein [Gracilibacillus sp. S3-1-1]MDX8046381.1 hypothetical protein [Gracilibacillus sp. S3-1-1]